MRNKIKSVLSLMILVALSVAGFTGTASAANWWENIKVKGDFRYRHEMIDKEGKDIRHRQRIRARFGIFAKANENINIGIQLATGSDDPVSTNQTLDGAASSKDIHLDLAYFTFNHEKVSALHITAGKMKNPFFKPGKAELIWDVDWNPEGGAITLSKKLDNVEIKVTGAGLWIDERSSSDDSYIAAGQGLVKFKLNEKKSSVTLGGSVINYVNAKDFAPFHDNEDGMGNSVVEPIEGEGIFYANNYELIEVFGEISHKFEEIPITLFGDFVSNGGADSLNTGLLFGIKVGKAKKAGSWEFRYLYREIEKDAVVGAFTNSDFGGGGTNSKGHEIGGAYQLLKNTAFKLTYFINEIGIDQNITKDYSRLQADIQLKF